jgi:chitosanase
VNKWVAGVIVAIVVIVVIVLAALYSQGRLGNAPVASAAAPASLSDPAKKDIAMQLVSSAENSSLDWKAQYAYIEDIGDGRGFTAGIIGFCSGTGDMLELVEAYTATAPSNVLAAFLPALRAVNGSDSHDGLDGFEEAWAEASTDPVFQAAQNAERDDVYFDPAVALAEGDGLGALGQFAYYDAAVVHGFGGLESIRDRALAEADPADEVDYLTVFLDEREIEMRKEAAHEDTTRVSTAQRVFLDAGNLQLEPPLVWHVYGDEYRID